MESSSQTEPAAPQEPGILGTPSPEASEPASPPDAGGPPEPAEPPTPTWWCSRASWRWTQFLQETHDQQAAGDDFRTLCEDCMQALQETCSNALSKEEFRVQPFDWTPDVRLEAFGSTKQGTALISSDIDVRMSFEQFQVRDKDRQLKYLKGIVAAPGKDFRVSMIITNSRIPLLRLVFKGQLSVDLTMGGGTAGESEASEDIACVDPYLVTLLKSGVNPEGSFAFTRLVKAFAKANSLVDAHAGFPSSTTWVFLTIAFLQREKCLPKGSTVLDDIDDDSDDAADAKDEGPAADGARFAGQLWPVVLSASFFLRFLLFVQHLQNRPIKVSLRDGHVGSARAWTNSGQRAPPLFLEHPQANRSNDNLSKSLTWSGWRKVGLCCQQVQTDLLPVKATAPPRQQEQDALRAAKRLFGSAAAGARRADSNEIANGTNGANGTERPRIPPQAETPAADLKTGTANTTATVTTKTTESASPAVLGVGNSPAKSDQKRGPGESEEPSQKRARCDE